ncbi:MAG: MarR family transcriptional regulator [Gammaproteobacteria bacterium]
MQWLRDTYFSSETKLNDDVILVKMVSERYDPAMAALSDVSDRTVAELVMQLGCLARGDKFIGDLTFAQWTAIRYFSRANRFSRTVSAFAEFHGTTRGTASQTVKSLVQNGYLSRKRSKSDGRSIDFTLTYKSKKLLAEDPFEALVVAAGALSNSASHTVARGLERMLRTMAQQRGKCHFGMCPSCKYFQEDGCYANGKPNYCCSLVDEPLMEAETQQLCVNFLPAR